jgi:hypothetical protein
MEQSELRSIVRPVAAPASDVSAAEEEFVGSTIIGPSNSGPFVTSSSVPIPSASGTNDEEREEPKTEFWFLRAILSCLF